MKIAVTYENGEIFGHFGHTKQFKVYETENGKIISSKVVDRQCHTCTYVVVLLDDDLA